MWSVIAVISHHCWVVSHAYWQMLLLRVGFRTNCRWSSIIYLFFQLESSEWRATQGFSVTKKQNWQPILLMSKLCFLVPRNRNVTFISNTQTHTHTRRLQRVRVSKVRDWNVTWGVTLKYFSCSCDVLWKAVYILYRKHLRYTEGVSGVTTWPE